MRRCKALKERLWGGEVGKKCTIELHWDCTVEHMVYHRDSTDVVFRDFDFEYVVA
jgi:hypothetical protein